MPAFGVQPFASDCECEEGGGEGRRLDVDVGDIEERDDGDANEGDSGACAVGSEPGGEWVAAGRGVCDSWCCGREVWTETGPDADGEDGSAQECSEQAGGRPCVEEGVVGLWRGSDSGGVDVLGTQPVLHPVLIAAGADAADGVFADGFRGPDCVLEAGTHVGREVLALDCGGEFCLCGLHAVGDLFSGDEPARTGGDDDRDGGGKDDGGGALLGEGEGGGEQDEGGEQDSREPGAAGSGGQRADTAGEDSGEAGDASPAAAEQGGAQVEAEAANQDDAAHDGVVPPAADSLDGLRVGWMGPDEPVDGLAVAEPFEGLGGVAEGEAGADGTDEPAAAFHDGVDDEGGPGPAGVGEFVPACMGVGGPEHGKEHPDAPCEDDQHEGLAEAYEHERPDGVDAQQAAGEDGKCEDFGGEDRADRAGEVEDGQEDVDGVADILTPGSELALPSRVDGVGRG